MKRLLILLSLLGIIFQASGQSTANYAFTTSTTGSLGLDVNSNIIDMSTGTTQLVGPSSDAGVSAVTNIGFNFYFMGNVYSQFSASADGWVGLGSAAVSGTTNAGASTTTPKIAAMGGDLYTGASGKVHYKLVGTSPNRCLVVEFYNMAVFYSTTASNAVNIYQVRLYESTGLIEYVYGNMYCGSTTYAPGYVGFGSGTTANTQLSVTTSTNTASTGATFNTNAYTAATNIANLYSAAEGSRRVYTFTPPTAPVAPSALNFTGVSGTGMTLNWTDNSSNETGFVIMRSTDGINYSSITTLAANTVTYPATGLNFNTLYYWKVIAVNEGAGNEVTGSQTTNAGTICGNKTIGGGGTPDYPTLTAAFADINTNGLACNVNLILQSGYSSAGETFPLIPSPATATGIYSITVYPAASGLSITSTAASTIRMEGCKNIIFDGRVNKTGIADLLIENTTLGVNPAILFINDATFDTIRYCNVKSRVNAISTGTIAFSTTTGASGNDFNVISDCNISDGTSTPAIGIHSAGTAGKENDNNKITNNNIFNYFSAGTISEGIYLGANNSTWTITGNHFYQTATRTSTTGNSHYGININNTGNNYVITDNFIGGSAPFCTGTPWTMTGAFANRFVGIYISAGTTTASSIQGNNITNFSWSSTSGATTQPGIWCGIYSVAGNINIGNLTGNTIGSPTGTGAVVATISTTGGVSYGIANASAGVVNISNNFIGAITLNGSTATVSHGFYGISSTAGSTLNILNNQVGSSTTLNSISNSASTNATNAPFYGIYNTSTNTVSILNNIIANMSNNYAGTSTAISLAGIYTSGGVNTITGNTLSLLSSTSPSTGTGSTSSVIGIYASVSAAGQTIAQNTIHSIGNLNPAAATAVTGIYYNGATTGTNLIARNFIHSLSLMSSSTSGVISGIYVNGGTTTYQNNMIRLGIDATGANITNGYAINGIYELTGTDNFYHNSIYIGGTGVSAGTSNTFAFRSSVTVNTRIIRNNLFVNTRSNGAATGKHYAITVGGAAPNPAGLTINNNDYFVNGTGSVFGLFNAADVASLSAWKTAVGQDLNSFDIDPQFISPTGNATAVNLHINTGVASIAEGAGFNLASVTDDFDGQARSGLTPTDIGADAFNGIAVSLVAINSVSANPATTQCTATSRTITANTTAGATPIVSVTLMYSFNGTPQTPIVMTGGTATGTSNWTATLPAATPANANVTWSVEAIDGIATITSNGTAYSDEPLTGASMTASASLSTVCSGSPTVLTAVVNKSGTGTIGSGATGNSSSTAVGAAYGTYWGNGHFQTLILASELTAQGFIAGNITDLSFNVTALGTPATLIGYSIKMGHTTATSITTFQSPTFTNVWGPSNYTPVTGTNTHTFASPFNWDGTSNIIVDICFANSITGTSSAVSTMTTTAFSSFVNYNADGAAGAGACTNTTVSNTSSNRPNMTFSGNKAFVMSTYAWSDGTSTVGTTNPATVNPTTSTTYTVTATDGNGCTLTAGPVVVNTNPIPSTPTATNSSQCGTAVPTCSVTSTSGAPSPVFAWYTVTTGGTAIPGITGSTYTGSAISTTTTFYVAEFDGTCESNRVAVTANVVSPDAVTAAATPNPTCIGNSVTLTATQSGSTQTYVYEWAAAPVAGSGIATTVTGASVTVTPSLPGTYVYTVTATDAGMGCATTADVSVTINEPPTGVTASADQTTVCAGNPVNLFALPNSGTVAVLNENFNAASNSWTPVNNSTGGTPGDAAWTLRPDGYNYTGTTFHSNDNSQFYMSNSDDQGSGSNTLTLLESPTFSTVGMTSCNLSFYHYFNASGDSAVVELFDGTNWVKINSYTTDIGAAASFVNANISLNSYLNLPSAKIRFRYKSAWGYYWAIDNVVVNGVYPTMTYAWSSSPAGFTSTNQNPTGVTPAATTTYTVAVTNINGCSSTADVTVNVTPLPSAPTANNSSQCGTQVPTCSVTSTSGATTPSFNWYTAATGGTPIPGITGNTYTGAAIGTTTTFYVTEADGSCESTPRTAVTVTVNLPDPVTASAVDSVCLGQSVTLTAAQTGTTNTYVYEWAAAPVTGSGIPTTVTGTPATVTPTAAGIYIYTVTATDAGLGCVTTASKTVKVNSLPSGVTATASNSAICLGASVDLFATPASGTVPVLSEDFNTATNAWITTNASTAGTYPDTAAWTLQPDGYLYSGTTFHSNDNSQFYLSNSDLQGSGGVTSTILESPSFSTVGMTACTLSFYHYYRHYASSGNVEVFDGTTWTSVAAYTTTQGTAIAFTNVTIPLNAYINLPAVKVRFRYEANYGYYWAIDNVVITGVNPVYTYNWSSMPVGFTSAIANPTGVIPTATTVYTVAVTNTMGCTSTASTTVNANAAPVVNLGNDTTICDNASITLNAQNNGMSYLWNTTATTQTITVDSTGYGYGTFPFWVTVDNSGCAATDTIYITFTVCGGVEENNGSVSIYPNPTHGLLYLSSGSFDDEMRVTLTTVDGKLILAENVNALSGTQQRKQIDLSQVPAGVYFVRLQGKNLDKITRIVKSY